MSTGGWIISILWTLIIFALIVGAIAWLVSELSNRRTSERPSEGSAREIIDRRLAKGELTIEQHEQLRRAIGEGVASTTTEPGASPVASAPG